MIDRLDQQTQALPLDEQPAKKRRGRPATGKAMTPAEKQRAYRERQKSNVTESSDGQINLLRKLLEDAEAARDRLAEEVVALKKAMKTDRTNKGNVAGNPIEDIGEWTIQFKFPRSRGWCSCDEPEKDLEGKPKGFEKVAAHVRLMNNHEGEGSGSRTTWRAVRDDGLIYEPKAPKSRGKQPAGQ